jgi:hypothetical protein
MSKENQVNKKASPKKSTLIGKMPVAKIAEKNTRAKAVEKSSHSAKAVKPAFLNIRSYQVGFGDCFLLTFHYPEAVKAGDRKRHVLIDFGSTGLPPGTPSDQMMRVAQDIRQECGGKLHVVVATHRHKDHISGFTTQDDRSGTGDIIAGLKPEAVIQPWTEDPKIDDSIAAAISTPMPSDKTIKSDSSASPRALNSLHVSSLMNMHVVSESILAEVRHLSDKRKFRQPLGFGLGEQIRFLADDNALPNKSAVENLRNMGKNYYVSHGSNLNFSKLLPGVDVIVLGPPTLDQHAAIKKQRSADKDEFWMLRAAAQKFWGQQAATASELLERYDDNEERLFPDADTITRVVPPHNRWFVRQLRAMRGEQMLSLVRILDKALNNTSVILLFDVGGRKLLFPGDAQIENWEYALSIDDNVKKLKDVEVYKVGHHGSRNATPKTLWEAFKNKSEKQTDKNRLKTVNSTMEGKHGNTANHSEVPRHTLVEALKSSSEYHTTQTAAAKGDLFEDIIITFTK